MAQDVLIVDDKPDALENFGNEVRYNLNIEPFLSKNPQEALDILRYYPIKVLVTDQVMPNMNGVELVRRLRGELNSRIPCIMLTGEPASLNSFDLVRLQFFDFIDKANAHAELVPSIRRAIQRYDTDEIFKNNILVDIPLAEQKNWIKFGTHIALKLIRISSVIDTYTREKDWQTYLIAQKGISMKQKLRISREVSYSYEYDISAETVSKIGLKAGELVSKVEAALENKVSLTGKIQHAGKVLVEAEQEFEVKDLDGKANSSGQILQSREYQSAPVYFRVNCVLEVQCNCCQIPKSISTSLDLSTNRIALRQIERFDKGPEQKIYTGFVQGTTTS